MLRPLPLACFRIVLFPSEAGLLPAIEDGLDKIQAKARV